MANLHYDIQYAEVGYEANLQKYVTSMRRSSEVTTWRFNRASADDKQAF